MLTKEQIDIQSYHSVENWSEKCTEIQSHTAQRCLAEVGSERL